VLQIEKTSWRGTLAGCRVTVYEHLEGTISLGYGPQTVGRYNQEGIPMLPPPPKRRRGKAVEKWKSVGDSHFPTATAAAIY
jgi:hypothetical protein